jgi:hypothetical protein
MALRVLEGKPLAAKSVDAIALFAVLATIMLATRKLRARIDLTDWTTVSRMRPHRPGHGIARWDHWSARCRRP